MRNCQLLHNTQIIKSIYPDLCREPRTLGSHGPTDLNQDQLVLLRKSTHHFKPGEHKLELTPYLFPQRVPSYAVCTYVFSLCHVLFITRIWPWSCVFIVLRNCWNMESSLATTTSFCTLGTDMNMPLTLIFPAGFNSPSICRLRKPGTWAIGIQKWESTGFASPAWTTVQVLPPWEVVVMPCVIRALDESVVSREKNMAKSINSSFVDILNAQ